MNKLHLLALGLGASLMATGAYAIGDMDSNTVALTDVSNTTVIEKDNARLPASARIDGFAPSACVSHVEIYGPRGVRYTLMSPTGEAIYDGVHGRNETIFFRETALPSVTTRVTKSATAHLVLVNAGTEAPESVASAPEIREVEVFEISLEN